MLKTHAALLAIRTYSTNSKVVKKQHTWRSNVHQSVRFDRPIVPPCHGPPRGRTPGRCHGAGSPGLRRAASRVRVWRHPPVHRERRRPTIASSPSGAPIAGVPLACRGPPAAEPWARSRCLCCLIGRPNTPLPVVDADLADSIEPKGNSAATVRRDRSG